MKLSLHGHYGLRKWGDVERWGPVKRTRVEAISCAWSV